ncbi:MAG TPA: hypothetical protein VN837_01860 [Chloroflexota bacterium]|nr:hypothetical protein [Chloroflexota bacterium]
MRVPVGRLVLAAATFLTLQGVGSPLVPTPTPHAWARSQEAAARLPVRIFARTGLHLGDILWTGSRFLYTAEGGRALVYADSSGRTQGNLATVPANGGEMRCVLSPGSHGFPTGDVFCHASANQIYAVNLATGNVSLFAQLPSRQASDGALAYDSVGAFGYKLLAATGGSDGGAGGTVFAIGSDRSVSKIGTYAGPGGAEQALVAPRSLGAAGGKLLLTIDKHDHLGRLLAMDPAGHVQTLAGGLAFGLDPLTMLTRAPNLPIGAAAPGLYVADWYSHNVLFIPASSLAPYAGDLLLTTERRGQFFVLRPSTNGAYHLVILATNLHQPDYNFEGAAYIG